MLEFPIRIWTQCDRVYDKGVLGEGFRLDGEAKPVAIGKMVA